MEEIARIEITDDVVKDGLRAHFLFLLPGENVLYRNRK